MSEEYNRYNLGNDPEKKPEETENTEKNMQNPVRTTQKNSMQNRKHSRLRVLLMHFLTERQGDEKRRRRAGIFYKNLYRSTKRKYTKTLVRKVRIRKINIVKIRTRGLRISLINFLPRFRLNR